MSLVVALPACSRDDDRASKQTVTLYCSVDRPFAEKIVADFEKRSGITVNIKSDKELTKTTGLVSLIRAEKDNPQADVFWSSELYNTIQLAEDGLLAEYRPSAEGIPEQYKDPRGMWTAVALRGRVIGYNTEQLDKADIPATWREITNEKWTGKLGVADPHYGTTRGHFAAFLALWGEQEYRAFLNELKAVTNNTLMTGNATAAREVANGRLAICATDTDDVIVRQRQGLPIDMTFPDMGDGGSLLIPNSVAMVKGGPNPDAAKQLIDYLTSAHLERMLAESDSANYPVRPELREELDMPLPPETKLTYAEIAAAMDQAIEIAGEVFSE